MNPTYKSTYDAWYAEMKASGDKLGGSWSPFVSSSYNPNLIRWLCSVFPIKNVLDLGCGAGEALRSFRMNGCQVLGVEGMAQAARLTDVPTIVHDADKGPLLVYNMDLVYSIEFCEHVANANSVIDMLTLGKMACFSHAVPNQPGWNHVNCQDDKYWIDGMAGRGFRYLKELSEYARTLDTGYFSQSGLLFIREDVDWGTFMGSYEETPPTAPHTKR